MDTIKLNQLHHDDVIDYKLTYSPCAGDTIDVRGPAPEMYSE